MQDIYIHIPAIALSMVTIDWRNGKPKISLLLNRSSGLGSFYHDAYEYFCETPGYMAVRQTDRHCFSLVLISRSTCKMKSVGLLYWYTTSAILAFLTVIHFTNLAFRYYTRAVAPAPPRREVESQVRVKSSTLRRFSSATLIAYEKYVLLTALPLPRWRLRWWIQAKGRNLLPTSELVWTFGYALGCLVLCFYGSEWF
jgi:hypothetical protein